MHNALITPTELNLPHIALMGMKGRRIVIGDIHGCAKTLRYLLEKMIKPQKGDNIFFLGDYIDRGPSSKEVIDMLLELKETGIRLRCLKGNHEEMVLNSMVDGQELENWKANGGDKTLLSFGIDHPAAMGEKYISFLRELEYYIDLGDYYLVHAGFEFSCPQPLLDTHSMLWIRDTVYTSSELKGRKVIHGHTPGNITDIINALKKEEPNNISIDAGCVYPNREGMGYLAAFDLDSRELIYTPNRESI
jgi:serine/threonine protein phosphatase 1